MFEAAVDRLRGAVAGAGAVEVSEHVSGALFQRSAEAADLDQRGGNTAGDGVETVRVID